jgi:hypothetical protein
VPAERADAVSHVIHRERLPRQGRGRRRGSALPAHRSVPTSDDATCRPRRMTGRTHCHAAECGWASRRPHCVRCPRRSLISKMLPSASRK